LTQPLPDGISLFYVLKQMLRDASWFSGVTKQHIAVENKATLVPLLSNNFAKEQLKIPISTR
jgi:hypothetical protein